MKLINIVTIAAALTAPLAVAQTEPSLAQPEPAPTEPVERGWWADHFLCCANMGDKFQANEFSVDLFATYVSRKTGSSDLFEASNGTWGGGVGANYFLTRMLGIGTDINMPHDGGNLVNTVNGSLILRLPIEKAGLAPYVFGGGGRTTDQVWEWTGHAGAGLEFRCNPVTGIFIDGRYVWADQTPDNALLRAGFRFTF